MTCYYSNVNFYDRHKCMKWNLISNEILIMYLINQYLLPNWRNITYQVD